MTFINPNLNRKTINNTKPSNEVNNKPSENKEAHKPTINELQDLVNLFFQTNLTYRGMRPGQKEQKQNEAIDKYIKDNNLEISRENLLFFINNLNRMSGTQEEKLQKFIDSGYNPTCCFEDLYQKNNDKLNDYLSGLENPDGNKNVEPEPTIVPDEPPKLSELEEDFNTLQGLFDDIKKELDKNVDENLILGSANGVDSTEEGSGTSGAPKTENSTIDNRRYKFFH